MYKKFLIIAFVFLVTFFGFISHHAFALETCMSSGLQCPWWPPSSGVTGFSVSINANPTSVSYGGSSTISWSSTDMTSCSVSNGLGWTGTLGKQSTGSLTSTRTYTATCTGTDGNTYTNSATVTVGSAPVPTASLSASPTTIASGQSSTLAWSSTNATYCTDKKGNIPSFPIDQSSGFISVSPTVTTTYMITCTGSGGTSTTASATVMVSTISVSLNTSSVSIAKGSTNSSVVATATKNYLGTPTMFSVFLVYGIKGTSSTLTGETGTVTTAGQAQGTITIDTSNFSGTYGQSFPVTVKATGADGTTTSSTILNITVTAPPTYPDLTAGAVTPTTAVAGTSTTFYSTISNIGNASTGASFYNAFEVATATGGNGSVSLYTATPNPMSALAANTNATASYSQTFSLGQTPSVRFCADMRFIGDTAGTIAESNEGNNCGPWANITVTAPPINGACSSPATHWNCAAGTSVSNASGVTYSGLNTNTNYTWGCNGLNGGTSTTSTACSQTTTVTMSGTLSFIPSSSCYIAAGASSCSINLQWDTTNPQATSAITSNLPSPGSTIFTGNSGYQSVSIPNGSRSFYLYNNNNLLASGTASASCTSGTSWNGSTCVTNPAPVNGACSSPATHYICAAGTSVSNASGVTYSGLNTNTNYTWGCNGLNGGTSTTSTACSQTTTVTMSGTLTPSSSSCIIADGSSSCAIPFSWSTTNPQGTSAVTSDTNNSGVPNANFSEATGNSGSNIPFTIPYSGRNFYLYNNSQLLAQSSVTSGCSSTSSWNSSSGTCVANPTTSAPTVSTTSPATNIATNSATGGGTIVSNGGATITVSGIVWSTSANPTTSSYIGHTTDGWATGGPWTDSMTGLSSGTTYHYRAYATNSVGTSYGSDVSFTTTTAVPTPTATISANPASITSGASSTITWSSTNAGSGCVGTNFNTGNAASGTVTVSPTTTTQYSIVCTGSGGQASNQATVTVDVVGTKQPVYQEK